MTNACCWTTLEACVVGNADWFATWLLFLTSLFAQKSIAWLNKLDAAVEAELNSKFFSILRNVVVTVVPSDVEFGDVELDMVVVVVAVFASFVVVILLIVGVCG